MGWGRVFVLILGKPRLQGVGYTLMDHYFVLRLAVGGKGWLAAFSGTSGS